MRIGFIFKYIKGCHIKLRDLSQKGEGSLLYLWFDFLSSAIVHGALINHYVRGGLYKLKGCERRKSMTYRRIVKAFAKMNETGSIKLLNNKHLFNAHFAPFVKRKWLYSKEMSFVEFSELCNSCSCLIIKPEDGVEGQGIQKITSPKPGIEREELYNKLVQGVYMIEEPIVQHQGMIYGNTSVNTIRAHTIMDKEGQVHLSKMLFRVGVGNSVVDNYAQGGCVYEVHLESGRIISPSLKKDGEVVYIHPQTEIFMLGRQIPNWDIVCDKIKKAHLLIPGCRFIGWDVAITEDDIELIEGNHNPDYEFYEFFGTKGWWPKIKKYF